jgi:hypothetical protein
MLTWAAAAAATVVVVLAVCLCAAGLLFCLDISLYPEFIAVFGRYRIDMVF